MAVATALAVVAVIATMAAMNDDDIVSGGYAKRYPCLIVLSGVLG